MAKMKTLKITVVSLFLLFCFMLQFPYYAHGESIYALKQSASQGNANAEFNLGNDYYYGIGVPLNYVNAVYWFRLSANQGNSNAECNLGYAYL